MSRIKRLLEQISVKMGYGGEITPEVEKRYEEWQAAEIDAALDRAMEGDFENDKG